MISLIDYGYIKIEKVKCRLTLNLPELKKNDYRTKKKEYIQKMYIYFVISQLRIKISTNIAEMV